MKPKVIIIGGNLRLNGISAFNMMIFENLRDEFEFIFINTAPGESHLRDEIISKGGRHLVLCFGAVHERQKERLCALQRGAESG